MDRILELKMIPSHTPTIIIYDSVIVYSHHLSLFSDTTTQRHLTRTVLPRISKSLSHRLQQAIIHHTLSLPQSYPVDVTTQSLIDTLLQTLTNFNVNNITWDNTIHISHISPIIHIKVKYHQLISLDHLRTFNQPSPYLVLVHKNHWADQIVELPSSAKHSNWFPLQYSQHRIRKSCTHFHQSYLPI